MRQAAISSTMAGRVDSLLSLGWGLGLTRDEILRGFFHRENRILLRKSQIFDLDTLFCSLHYCKKKFKKPDLLDLWKNPLAFPCLEAGDVARAT